MSIERDNAGRFTPGNSGGPGNPHAKKIAQLRKAMFSEASALDIRRIFRKMISQAADGDVEAARLVLERLLGKIPALSDDLGGAGMLFFATPPGAIPSTGLIEAELEAETLLKALVARQQTGATVAEPPTPPPRTPNSRGAEI